MVGCRQTIQLGPSVCSRRGRDRSPGPLASAAYLCCGRVVKRGEGDGIEVKPDGDRGSYREGAFVLIHRTVLSDQLDSLSIESSGREGSVCSLMSPPTPS